MYFLNICYFIVEMIIPLIENDFLSKMSDESLWKLYPEMISELKKRKLITTRNLVGEYGEFLAINYYTKTKKILELIQVIYEKGGKIPSNKIDLLKLPAVGN